jgi:hypothetical protein
MEKFKNHLQFRKFSSRIFGSAPNSPKTRCHLFDLVDLTSLWHSHRRVHSAGSTFTFFKLAICTHVSCRVYLTRYLGNAMQRRFSILALGSVYDVAQTNLWHSLWTKFTNVVNETPCRRDWLLIGDFPKLVELTPCGHRSEKNSISTAKE